MTALTTAPVGAKGQMTLPKKVRQLLRLNAPGELVGFLVDERTHAVRLTKVDLVPADDPFTAEEYQKLIKLTKTSGGKTFTSYEAFLKDLKRHIKRR